jgi:hypothetical protein
MGQDVGLTQKGNASFSPALLPLFVIYSKIAHNWFITMDYEEQSIASCQYRKI